MGGVDDWCILISHKHTVSAGTCLQVVPAYACQLLFQASQAGLPVPHHLLLPGLEGLQGGHHSRADYSAGITRAATSQKLLTAEQQCYQAEDALDYANSQQAR
jgi:hypothetical protein